MTEADALNALLPIIILLALGIATAIASRAVRLSPIVGYIALGLALRGGGVPAVFGTGVIALLAEVGVMFLLFDVGLHFSLKQIREQASDIFAFGPLQVLFATAALALVGMAFGLTLPAAALAGAILALSSTAVVVRLIAERHQQGCPVGMTATSILIFQDVAAIFLLIIAGSLQNGSPVAMVAVFALGKAVLAFGVAVIAAHLLIKPLLVLVAGSHNEEVFTAAAVLIALAAGWATGQIGLSLTLGAFLGGLTLSETPYRAVIQSEVTPFRGLLLGFFFIYVGFSLDPAILAQHWFMVIAVATLLVGVKILTNIAASRVFRWSVAGSTQLGFLLSQGSEFAFVILGLPVVRAIVGQSQSSILVAAVALSMAATPNLAEFGRSLAGYMRRRSQRLADAELTPRKLMAPVIIIGMGRIGRALADALIHFDVSYVAIERDLRRLREAIADGYDATFGDAGDIRLWESVDLHQRKISVLTAPDLAVQTWASALVAVQYPDLKRFAVVSDAAEGDGFKALGLTVIVENGKLPGAEIAAAVLTELGRSQSEIDAWMRQQQERNSDRSTLAAVAA
ncbi:MAG TPA: cation:proton antiporter [Methylovirgula sp.]